MRELGMKRITIYVGATTHAGLLRLADQLDLPLATLVRGAAMRLERAGLYEGRLAKELVKR